MKSSKQRDTEEFFERRSVIRKEKKKKVNNPLTNTELACVALFIFQRQGMQYVRSHLVRKFMYLQKFGDMNEWGSSWYTDYFRRQSLYLEGFANVDELYTYMPVYDQPGGVFTAWKLLDAGRDIAKDAIHKLARANNCNINHSTSFTTLSKFKQEQD
ncbi:MAG: hypothetical protein NUW00_04860 [Candidatus Kaiserbacteria bacterium]|nr:hypothetical protein [Candidatus Kaiserbacteria bacterium]MCR4330907.1 hypothetical protein [Patescibacteria group bacterium]